MLGHRWVFRNLSCMCCKVNPSGACFLPGVSRCRRPPRRAPASSLSFFSKAVKTKPTPNTPNSFLTIYLSLIRFKYLEEEGWSTRQTEPYCTIMSWKQGCGSVGQGRSRLRKVSSPCAPRLACATACSRLTVAPTAAAIVVTSTSGACSACIGVTTRYIVA